MNRRHAGHNEEKERYGVEHARIQRKYVYQHFAVFVIVHIAFIFLFGLVPASELPSGSYFLHLKDWILSKKIGYYENEIANMISGIWTTVLIIHAVGWGLWYTLFPKKKPVQAQQDKQRNDRAARAEKKTAIPDQSKEKKETPSPTVQKTIPESRAWVYVFIGGLMEIIWATSFKTGSIGLLTIAAILVSFDLLIRAAKKIPIGTVYAVFTGIGAIGTILVDMLLLNEPMNVIKIFLILLLASFIAGLKFTGDTSNKGVK